MDTSSLIASLVGAQAGALQQAVAMRVMKQNIDAERMVLQLLEPVPAASSSANLAQGIGGNLDLLV
jgi:hypothetical protein